MVKLSGYIKFERHIIGGKTTRELSEEQGVCIGTIRSRIAAGWTDQEMLNGYRLYKAPIYNGMTLMELARHQGVRYDSVRDRKKRGWTTEEIIDPEKRRRGYLFVIKKKKNYSNIAEEKNISVKVLRSRFKEFYRIEDAIRASLNHRKNKKCNTLS